MRRQTIEVDEEVFKALQMKATPFVDTPNDVLRRLLLGTNQAQENRRPSAISSLSDLPAEDADAFARRIIEREFGASPTRRPPYRLMFEYDDLRVYAQNFNKKSDHVWYRVTEGPWRELRRNDKKAWLCFTNPAEKYAFLIPVQDVQRRMEQVGYNRRYLEVNINAVEARWSELQWNISPYLKRT